MYKVPAASLAQGLTYGLERKLISGFLILKHQVTLLIVIYITTAQALSCGFSFEMEPH